MLTRELSLLADNFYTMDVQLIFYLPQSAGESARDELLDAEFITVRNQFAGNDGDVYVFMTANYAYYATRRYGKDNISVNKVVSGRDYREGKAEHYRNKTYVIRLDEGMGVIYQNTKYPENDDWEMDPDDLDDLLNAIHAYFTGETEKEENEYRLSRNLLNQILQPIENFTHYEDLMEQRAVYGDTPVLYDRYEVVSSKARSKIYNFYSSSFDPESESYNIGDRVSVETNEQINDEMNRMLKGYIVDRVNQDDSVLIQVEFRDQFDDFILEKTAGRILPAVNEAQKQVRERVVGDIKRGKVASRYMYQLFSKYEPAGYERQPGWEDFRRDLENREHPPVRAQMEAIQKGIETRDIQLVLGPPGTGKTTVIVAWVEYFIGQGKRVLISSQNNAAVDNVLERIHSPKAKIIRLGRIQKIQDNCRQYSLEQQRDRAVELYNDKISQSSAGVAANIGDIEEMLSCVEEAEKEYLRQEEYDMELAKQKGIVSDTYAVFLSCARLVEEKRKELSGIRAKKAKIEYDLQELSRKNALIRFFSRSKIKKAEEDLKGLITEEENGKDAYEISVNRYNAESAKLQKMLNDPDSVELVTRADAQVRKCASYDFDHLKLRGYMQVEPPDLSANARGKRGYYKLSEYKDRLKAMEETERKIERALQGWKTALETQRNDIVLDLLIRQSNVVGATCIGINTERKFRNVDFDVSIIDESGQIQIHNVIVPMTRAPKTLMLGDHKQIPPMADDEMVKMCREDGVKTELLEKSFFEYLFTKLERKDSPNLTRLDEQFRMPGIISDVISESFYDGRYRANYDMRKWEPVIPGTHSPLVMISTSRNRHRFEVGKKSADDTPGYCNPLEAEIVARIIKRIYRGQTDPDESQVGIISAYGKQVRLIRRKIQEEKLGFTQDQIYSLAASLDSFQGQERPLIIYSSTRSTGYRKPDQARVGFLKELRRLNVAFTRCKRQLVIIGDFDYLTSCEYEDTDSETGEPLANKSEKDFSDFMRKMVVQATSGDGEYYDLADFYEKAGIRDE